MINKEPLLMSQIKRSIYRPMCLYASIFKNLQNFGIYFKGFNSVCNWLHALQETSKALYSSSSHTFNTESQNGTFEQRD